MRALLAALCLLFFVASPDTARAATLGFSATFWDANRSFAQIDEAIAYAEANDPDAAFIATAIDYPNGAQNVVFNFATTLEDYLGTNATGLVDGQGNPFSGPSGLRLRQSVFRFTGKVELPAGLTTLTVGSDDGYRLIVNDQVVSEQVRPRSFRETEVVVDLPGGTTEFELYYYENFGRTGVEFWINDTIVDNTIIATPLPAGASLMLAALGGFGLLALRCRRAATS